MRAARAAVFNEPLNVFTNPADFGETVMIDGQPVRCIFDREYAADNGYGISAGNADPYLICLSAELPDTVAEAEIQVRGVAYRVAEVQADGTGITVLQLRAKNEPAPTY
ncbi:head-tail joining protein [Neisseria sp. P0013.S004]|uniref:head-tail joining protein n=1 Tax=unclassified Neisseria TaxID=2623750 RepID=UPI003F812807